MNDAAAAELTVGIRSGDHVSIRIHERERPASDDYWDGNWLASTIDFGLGSFCGNIRAALRAEELRAFREQVERIWTALEGEAVLESIESWISMRMVVDVAGHVGVTGVLRDQDANELRFVIDGLDQSYLPALVAELRAIESSFPVLGAP